MGYLVGSNEGLGPLRGEIARTNWKKEYNVLKCSYQKLFFKKASLYMIG